MKTAGILLTGMIALGVLGCAPNAYRVADESTVTSGRATTQRPAHCRDLPADVPCRHADTGR